MIRPTIPADTAPLVALTDETRFFKPPEIVALREVLDDYHTTNHKHGHCSVTFEQDGKLLGFAYYAPVAMTDRSWSLYWIAVTKQTQARGIGSQLLRHVEEDIRAKQGRLLLIDTSSLPHYEPTRNFYLKHNYEQATVLADFYADGDNLIVYRKRMERPAK